jgi:hypothetical protein
MNVCVECATHLTARMTAQEGKAMFRKLILLSAIVISIGVPMMAHAAPMLPKAKSCKLYGQPVAHGYQIDFQDRWGNTIRSYTCFDGVWLRTMRA